MEEDSPKARVCEAISGIGLSPIEGVDVLASVLFDLLLARADPDPSQLDRCARRAAETISQIHAESESAADALMTLTLAILQITQAAKEAGVSVPPWRKRGN